MPLILCRFCKREISDRETICPHCRRVLKGDLKADKTEVGVGVKLGAITIVIATVVSIYLSTSNSFETTKGATLNPKISQGKGEVQTLQTSKSVSKQSQSGGGKKDSISKQATSESDSVSVVSAKAKSQVNKLRLADKKEDIALLDSALSGAASAAVGAEFTTDDAEPQS